MKQGEMSPTMSNEKILCTGLREDIVHSMKLERRTNDKNDFM